MRWMLAGLISLGFVSQSYAESPRIGVEEFPRTFNKEAKRSKLRNRMTLSKCESGEQISCTYMVTGKVALLADADKGSKNITSLIVMGGSDTDTVAMMSTYAVVLTVLSPESDKEARGAAIGQLMSEFAEKRESTVLFEESKFQLKAYDSLGVVLFVKLNASAIDEPSAEADENQSAPEDEDADSGDSSW